MLASVGAVFHHNAQPGTTARRAGI